MKFTDQTGYPVYLDGQPRRIISLVPSQTELLFDLGLDEEIVGITRFCGRPADKCATRAVVGGTKQFSFERIAELEPDLIIGNQEENYREGIERLRQDYPVWVSDVLTLPGAYNMIASIGALTGREEAAATMIHEIQSGIATLPRWSPIRVAYFIWRSPLMVAGHGTFIQEMLHQCGLVNVFGHLPRYPEVTGAQVRQARPEILLLSSEPYPFSDRHLSEFSQYFPGIQPVLVDGQIFSWYGSRLLQAPAYLRALRQKLNVLVKPRKFPYDSGE